MLHGQENRSMDGLGSNIANPEWGSKQTSFRNYSTNGFAELLSEPGGQDRKYTRVISIAIDSQDTFIENELGLSDFICGWGQFIAHNVNLNDDDFF